MGRKPAILYGSGLPHRWVVCSFVVPLKGKATTLSSTHKPLGTQQLRHFWPLLPYRISCCSSTLLCPPCAGGSIGVSAGLYNYATVKPDIPLDTWKLKANRLLNNSGKTLSRAGVGAGCAGQRGIVTAGKEAVLAAFPLTNMEESPIWAREAACSSLTK